MAAADHAAIGQSVAVIDEAPPVVSLRVRLDLLAEHTPGLVLGGLVVGLLIAVRAVFGIVFGAADAEWVIVALSAFTFTLAACGSWVLDRARRRAR